MRKLTSTRHETPELPIKRHLNADIWLSLERSRAVQGFDLSQDFSEGRPFQGILGPTGLAPHHFWECLSKQSTKAKCTVDYKSALIEFVNISSIFPNFISCHIVSHHFIHCLKDNFHLRTLAFWKKTHRPSSRRSTPLDNPAGQRPCQDECLPLCTSPRLPAPGSATLPVWLVRLVWLVENLWYLKCKAVKLSMFAGLISQSVGCSFWKKHPMAEILMQHWFAREAS